MNKELDDALCRDFPLLYVERNWTMQQTCMCWGFSNDGWEPLTRRLSEKLEPMIQQWIKDHPGEEGHHPRCVQHKEKFGTLRFYMGGDVSDEMQDLVDKAEEESAVTCEDCGAPGQLYTQGWHLTQCEPCRAKYMKEKYGKLPELVLLEENKS